MKRLRYLAQARKDLADIGEGLVANGASERVIHDLLEGIVAQCERIAAHDGLIGRTREELAPSLRSFALGRYIIFFRYEAAELQIVHVLHGARDIDAIFEQERDSET